MKKQSCYLRIFRRNLFTIGLIISLCLILEEPRGQTPPPETKAISVLDYLKSISGKSTVSGIHNREPNSKPILQTDRIFELTGKYPGLWSGDFLFRKDDVQNRWTMIHECRRQWERGAIVQLLLHVAPPNQPEVCQWRGGILSHLNDKQWKDLVTNDGELNKMEGYATYFTVFNSHKKQNKAHDKAHDKDLLMM